MLLRVFRMESDRLPQLHRCGARGPGALPAVGRGVPGDSVRLCAPAADDAGTEDWRQMREYLPPDVFAWVQQHAD